MGDEYYNDIVKGKSPNYPSSSSTTAYGADTEEEGEVEEEEHEHMFEKVVTPSDVGKLNRLVIPKQHAERYFPLDPASNEKGGLLLSFEEERGTGRPTWHFRYSYWNSSQSYVITKGWSRFVKDKRLDSGDTVAFSRAPATGRLFIDWRRRPSPPLLLHSMVVPTWGWGATGLFLPPPPPMTTTSYYRPVGPTLAPPKRVRLFGVNLDGSAKEEQPEKYILPPSPLQWRLSPVPSPIRNSEISQLERMDLDGRIKEKGS